MSYRKPLYSPNSPEMIKGDRREQREPPPPPPSLVIRQRGGMSLSGSGSGSGSGGERTTPATATTMSTRSNGVGVGGVDGGGSSSTSNDTGNGMGYGTNENGHDAADMLAETEVPEQSNIPAIRSRPWVRLDRLLRRWLPGYTLLRSLAAGGASSDVATGSQQASAAAGNSQAEMDTTGTGIRIGIGAGMTTTTSGQSALSQQQQLQQQRATVRLVSYGGAMEPSLVVRKRQDGEVFLDTGIAKSEFCLKLEKLLRAKMVEKE